MAYKTVEVDIDIDLEDFDDGELEDEVERRNLGVRFDSSGDMKQLINSMYYKYRLNQPIDTELREFFYETIGRIA